MIKQHHSIQYPPHFLHQHETILLDSSLAYIETVQSFNIMANAVLPTILYSYLSPALNISSFLFPIFIIFHYIDLHLL